MVVEDIMKTLLDKFEKKNIFIKYSILFFICGGIIFSPQIILHRSFVSFNDNFNQFYPVLCKLAKIYRNLIPDILHGHFSTYDTTLGFGDDIIGVLGFYGLGDIFTLPSVFFPEKYMSYCFSLMVVVRLYLCGLNFIIYARFKKFDDTKAIIGGLLYAFSFSTIIIGLSAFTFVSSPVYFPLIILGIDKILEKKASLKDNIYFICVIFLQSMCGFYFLYMDILACLFYLILSLFFMIKDRESEAVKASDILKRLFNIAASATVGVAMSAFLLLPQVIYYFQTQRGQSTNVSFFNSYFVYEWKHLKEVLSNIMLPTRGLYEYGLVLTIMMFFICICCISNIYYICSGKCNRKYSGKNLGQYIEGDLEDYSEEHQEEQLKNHLRRGTKNSLLCLVSVIGYFFPAVCTIMNGFSHPEIRWIYIGIFFLIFASLDYLDDFISHMSKRRLWCYFITYAVLIFGIGISDTTASQKLVRVAIYSALWAVGYKILKIITNQNEVIDRKEDCKKEDCKKEVCKKEDYKKVGKTRSKEAGNISIFKFQRMLLSLMLVNMILTMFLENAPIKIGGSGAASDFIALNFVDCRIKDSKLSEFAGNSRENEFNRIDVNDTSLDAPLQLGINSTYMYYSLCNGQIFNFFEKMRVSPAIIQTFCLQGLDSRKILESLFSVSSYAKNTDSEQKEMEIVKNDYFLPLGIMYDEAIGEDQVEELDYLSKMNLLTKAVIVDNRITPNNEYSVKECYDNSSGNTYKAISGDSSFNTKEYVKVQEQIPFKMEFEDVKTDDKMLSGKKGAKIKLVFDSTDSRMKYVDNYGCELYLKIKNLTSHPEFANNIQLADRSIRIWDPKIEWFYHGNYDYLINVSSCIQNGCVELTFQDDAVYNYDGFELIFNKMVDYEDNYKKLLENSNIITDREHEDSSFIFRTDEISDAKWMFVSFPYSDGWSCEIDGQKTDIKKADYGFMAVKVPKGKHEIAFTYNTVGLMAGGVISVIGLAFFIILIVRAIVTTRSHDY